MTLGNRKLVGLCVSLGACLLISVLGLIFARDQLIAVAALEAPVVTLFGIYVTGTWGEWVERRKDQSSIADQVRAENEK